MKKLLLLAVVVGGPIALLRRMPEERREKISQLREEMAGRMKERMGRMWEEMPDDLPPKVMTSSLRNLQDQNEQLLALMREQNDLLRQLLPPQEPPSPRSRSARAESEQEGGEG